MTNFKPTYLYVKEREGLLYFGKTTSDNPTEYKGSGVEWKKHLENTPNAKTNTIWTYLFTGKEELVEFAEFFSDFYDIVKSDKWANQKKENGLDEQKAETSRKLSAAGMGRVKSEVSKKKLSDTWNLKSKEEQDKIIAKRTLSLRQVTYEPISCPYCGTLGRPSNIKRYHFDKCKLIL